MQDPMDILFDNATLTAKIAEMARQIEEDYEDEPVLLLGVLKGSLHFLSDLGRHLRLDTQIDFIQTSSYQGTRETTGVVKIVKDIETNLAGLNVIIVEDIVDTGTTLNHLRELLSLRNPKSLRVAALLSKPAARRVETPVEYVGFEIPNEFVVGYGLDYAERYRNLPYIAILREE
ncbi:hypoxanthine phosphoribosyltransferase [bacterium]|nr:MAG: hypoxanthine phosphoribosyltransferase [bacterium]